LGDVGTVQAACVIEKIIIISTGETLGLICWGKIAKDTVSDIWAIY